MTTIGPRCFGCMAPASPERRCECGWEKQQNPVGSARRIGTHLTDRYLLGRTLGQPGGFGVTYLGYDLQLGRRVAIKEFFPRQLVSRDGGGRVVPHGPADEEAVRLGVARFLEEARVLARFDHAHIVRVLDFFPAEGSGYLVMPYYPGQTLASYLEAHGNRLAPAVAVGLLLPILDALREIHAAGVLHRDIKPRNIYLATGGHPLLLDFGAARPTAGGLSHPLTRIISDGFAPIEQYAGEPQGPWTDVYACGATLLELLSGRTPPSAIERRRSDPLAVSGNPWTSGLDQRVQAAVLSALALEPAARPPSIDSWQAMLLESIASRQATSTPPRSRFVTTVTVAPPVRGGGGPSRRGLAIAGIALAILLVALLATIGPRDGTTGLPPAPPAETTPPPLAASPAERRTQAGTIVVDGGTALGVPPSAGVVVPIPDAVVVEAPPVVRRPRIRARHARPSLGSGETFLDTPLGHYYRHLDD